MVRGMGKRKSATSGIGYPENETAGGGPRDRETELRWLDSNRKKLEERYSGEWIVLEGQQVVSHGRDAALVLSEARARGTSVPFLIRIPSKDEGRLALEAGYV